MRGGYHMSERHSSAERKLENQSLGPLQLRVAFICTLAQMFDGYDINAIGMAAPALRIAWHLPAAAFANTFVMSSVGIMVGALLSGPAGDRVGRKPVLLVSLVFLAASSLGCVLATSVTQLVLLRFLTGIGIGGIMPVTVALTSGA